MHRKVHPICHDCTLNRLTRKNHKEHIPFMKALIYALLAILLRIVFFLTDLLPLPAVFKLCDMAAALYMFSSRRYKKRIRNNLKIAFGTSCDDQLVQALTGKVTKNLGLIFAETLLSGTTRRDSVLEKISIQGTENLDNALSSGKGVIAVSAHLGNFSLLSVAMLKRGYPFTMLVKESKYPGIAKAARDVQEKQGGHFIYIEPWSQALRHIMSALRNNEIVCLLADENKKDSETVVDFLGHPAPTADGPAVLSLRTGALVVPIFIVRHADLSHTIFIEPHLTPELTSSISGNILTITTAYTKVIEHYVRKYPDQWFWVNKRWKKARAAQGKGNSSATGVS